MAARRGAPTIAGMRRLFPQLAVLLAAVVVAGLLWVAPARADQTRVRVDTKISVGMYDTEVWPLADEHCGKGGTTSQELVRSDGSVHLGGRPEPFAESVGPFVDRSGTPVDFFCGGEVSLCFFPTQVSVTTAGEATVTMLASFYEADPSPLGRPWWPCDKDDFDASSFVRLTVPAGQRRCLGANVDIGDTNSDHATIGSFCVTVTSLGAEPGPLTESPRPPQLRLTSLTCESLDETYTCDVAYTGGTAPVAIRWTVGGNAMPAYNDVTPVTGTCVVGRTVTARVVLTDATGASVQRTDSTTCLGAGS
jgi:hypothetical protein